MKTEIKKPSYEVLCEAAELIKKGEVVAIPTETVYGLAADAYNPEACEKIFKAKGRPQDNPLIIHICDLDMLKNSVKEIPSEIGVYFIPLRTAHRRHELGSKAEIHH